MECCQRACWELEVRVGCAREVTVSTGRAEEAAAVELASLCGLALSVNLHQRNLSAKTPNL